MDDKDLIKMTNKEAAEILKNIYRPRSRELGGRKNGIIYGLNMAVHKAINLLEQTPDKQADVPKELLSRDFDGDPPSINALYFIQILKDTFGNWGYPLLTGCLRLNIPVYLYGIPATGKTLITRTLREAGFMISESGDYDKGPMYIPPITDDPIQPLVLQANYRYHPTIFLDFKPVADDIRKYILEEDLTDANRN